MSPAAHVRTEPASQQLQNVVYGAAGELKQMVDTEMKGAFAGPVRTSGEDRLPRAAVTSHR